MSPWPSVREIATTSPITVTPDTRLSEARELMGQHQIRRLPVMKAEVLEGILGSVGCLLLSF